MLARQNLSVVNRFIHPQNSESYKQIKKAVRRGDESMSHNVPSQTEALESQISDYEEVLLLEMYRRMKIGRAHV